MLIYDAPADVLDLAEQHHLKVIYCFALDWYSIGGPKQAAITTRVVDRVTALREKPALLAWLLGNEVGGDALARFEDALHSFYTVRSARARAMRLTGLSTNVESSDVVFLGMSDSTKRCGIFLSFV